MTILSGGFLRPSIHAQAICGSKPILILHTLIHKMDLIDNCTECGAFIPDLERISAVLGV